MKYRVITTKYMVGEIVVNAKDKDEAQQKAYDIAKNNEFKWHEEEKIDIHEIHEVPVFCKNCNAKLSPGSFFCNRCGTKLEEEIDLGRIFSTYFDKTCQTTWIFDKFYNSINAKAYNTIMLKSAFYIWKVLPESNMKELSATVSFYIKDTPIKHNTESICGYTTISNIKNKYSEKVMSVYEDRSDPIYSVIADAFIEEKYDSNGDYFFEKPISFRAQDNYNRGEGFGRTSTYYIVGVNFKI